MLSSLRIPAQRRPEFFCAIIVKAVKSAWSSRRLLSKQQHLFLSEMMSVWGDHFSFPVGMRRGTVMASPEAVRQIFENRDDHLCAATGRRMVVGILPPESLPYQSGQKHHRARRAVGTAFAKAIGQFDAQSNIDQFVQELKADADLPNHLARFCIRLACEFVIGRSNTTIESQTLLNAQAMDHISPVALAVPWLRQLPWHKRRFSKFGTARDQLIAKIESLQNVGDYSDTSFLHYLVQSCQREGVDSQQCCHNATTIVLAIAYNLQVVLLNTLQQLSKHDHWQSRLRRAICTALANEQSDSSPDKLAKAIVKESLRLQPLVPLIGRYVKADTKIDDVQLRAGQLVFVSPWLSHLSKTQFDDPTLFNPGRFLERSNYDNRFIPFGGGKRHCPATGWATQTMGQVIKELVTEFKWQESESNDVKPSHQMAAFNLIPATFRISITEIPIGELADA